MRGYGRGNFGAGERGTWFSTEPNNVDVRKREVVPFGTRRRNSQLIVLACATAYRYALRFRMARTE